MVSRSSLIALLPAFGFQDGTRRSSDAWSPDPLVLKQLGVVSHLARLPLLCRPSAGCVPGYLACVLYCSISGTPFLNACAGRSQPVTKVERSPLTASRLAMIDVGENLTVLSPNGLVRRDGEKPLFGSRPIAATSVPMANILDGLGIHGGGTSGGGPRAPVSARRGVQELVQEASHGIELTGRQTDRPKSLSVCQN